MSWINNKTDRQKIPVYFLLAQQIPKEQSNLEVYSKIEEGVFQTHPIFYKPLSLILEKKQTPIDEEVLL